MASTPARRSSPSRRPAPSSRQAQAKAEPESDLEVVSTAPDGETFVGRLFGEYDFTFSTDTNFYLQLTAFSGDVRAPVALLHSMLEVEPQIVNEETGEVEDIEVARRRIQQDFDSALGSQRRFGPERLYRLLNDLTVAAGNATSTS